MVGLAGVAAELESDRQYLSPLQDDVGGPVGVECEVWCEGAAGEGGLNLCVVFEGSAVTVDASNVIGEGASGKGEEFAGQNSITRLQSYCVTHRSELVHKL